MTSKSRVIFTTLLASLAASCATSPSPPPPEANGAAAIPDDAAADEAATESEDGFDEARILAEAENVFGDGAEAVSYTHLTLPTIYSV